MHLFRVTSRTYPRADAHDGLGMRDGRSAAGDDGGASFLTAQTPKQPPKKSGISTRTRHQVFTEVNPTVAS